MEIAKYIFPESILEAIGWTILHTFWQGALLAIILAIMLVFMQKFSSRTRYIVTVVFMGLFLISALTTFIWIYNPASFTVNHAANTLPVTQEEVPLQTSNEQETIDKIEAQSFYPYIRAQFKKYFYNHIPLIVTCWLAGIIILSLKFLGSLAYIERLKHAKIFPIPDHWASRTESLRKKLNIKKPVTIHNSKLATSPMTIGIFKPVILLPVQIITGLSEKQVEAILAHELAHIKRNDYTVNIIQSLLEILFFYHPAIWWISSTVRHERENSCDDMAVSLTGETVDYARALINIQEKQFQPNTAPAVSFSGSKNKFSQRIMRIINKPTLFADYKEGFVTAFIITIGLSIIALSAFTLPPKSTSTEAISVQSNTQSLLNAVKNNNYKLAKSLLNRGVHIDEKDDKGYTPLMWAVRNNNYDISKMLINQRADINAKNDDKWTVLMESADEEDERIAALLIKKGAKINEQDEDGRTSLFEAVDHNKTKIVKMLLENGANLEDLDEDGRTPLMVAVQNNSYPLTQLLIDRGANINVENRDGWTMLMHAADEDDPNLASLLIKEGANVNKRNYTGWCAMFEAVKHDKYDIAKVLLENDAEVNIVFDNYTPLRYAVKENNYLLTKLLVEHGADVNAKGAERGTTILIEAADEENFQIAELLIKNGANVNGAQYNGWTALYEAIKFDKNDISQLLIQHGADVNWQQYNDLTPLMYAIEEGDFELVIMLVENGADVHAQRKNGWSVLEIAHKTRENAIINYIESQPQSQDK